MRCKIRAIGFLKEQKITSKKYADLFGIKDRIKSVGIAGIPRCNYGSSLINKLKPLDYITVVFMKSKMLLIPSNRHFFIPYIRNMNFG